jgi:hypothetical protein
MTGRRVTGAALYQRVIKELRAELAGEYGLPIAEYDSQIEAVEDLGADMQPVLYVRFTRRTNGATITIDSIMPDDDGTIIQRSSDIKFR